MIKQSMLTLVGELSVLVLTEQRSPDRWQGVCLQLFQTLAESVVKFNPAACTCKEDTTSPVKC